MRVKNICGVNASLQRKDFELTQWCSTDMEHDIPLIWNENSSYINYWQLNCKLLLRLIISYTNTSSSTPTALSTSYPIIPQNKIPYKSNGQTIYIYL